MRPRAKCCTVSLQRSWRASVRSSSVRRSPSSLNVAGLYPAGEGAGYAGGIMSAGVDGIEVAEVLAAELLGLATA